MFKWLTGRSSSGLECPRNDPSSWMEEFGVQSVAIDRHHTNYPMLREVLERSVLDPRNKALACAMVMFDTHLTNMSDFSEVHTGGAVFLHDVKWCQLFVERLEQELLIKRSEIHPVVLDHAELLLTTNGALPFVWTSWILQENPALHEQALDRVRQLRHRGQCHFPRVLSGVTTKWSHITPATMIDLDPPERQRSLS